MGIVTGVLEYPAPQLRGGINNPNIPISAATVEDLWGTGATTASGASVSEQSAITIPAYSAGVRLLSETIASLPLGVFRRRDDGGREPVRDHPMWRLLHDQPNDEITSFTWRETGQGHLTTWGNTYSEIVRDGAGRVSSLQPITPDRVTVKRMNGQVVYDVTVTGKPSVRFRKEQMLHVLGLGWDGLVGYSPVRMHREALGLAMAESEFGSRFYSNDSRPAGMLSHPGKLSKDGIRNLRDHWEAQHKGAANSHKVAVVGEGIQYEQVGIPPEDAQYLESKKFSITEIARILRVPPHMIGDLERSTFDNIEHQSIEFVKYSIVPWVTRWEMEIGRKLFTPEEQATHFVKFNLAGLLRGDTVSRFEAYKIARDGGWMSANDILKKEDENPIPDGDTYLVPLNMTPADQLGQEPPVQQTNSRAPTGQTRGRLLATRAHQSLDTRRATLKAFEPLLLDVASRIVSRETSAARRALQSIEVLDDWTDIFYESHREYMVRALRPTLVAYMSQIVVAIENETGAEIDAVEMAREVQAFAEHLATRYTASSANQLKKLASGVTDDEAFREVIGERLDGWSDTRAGQFAANEVVRAGGAFAKAALIAAGVEVLRWVTFGENCPFCDSLDGTEVRTVDDFVEGGVVLPGGEDHHDMEVRRSIGHPPLHKGCDCMIVAGG